MVIAARTIEAARTEYLAQRRPELRPASVRAIRADLLSLSRHVGEQRPVTSVTTADVGGWWRTLEVAPATRQKMTSSVKVWFRWMADRDWIGRDPTRLLPRVRKPRSAPRALDRTDVERLWRACDPRTRLCVSLMLHEGLRRGEVARLQWGHIYPSERVMLVEGKGGHERVVPISDTTWDLLQSAPSRRAGYVVWNLRHPCDGVTPETVTDIIRDTMRSVGIAERPHALRHTAATDALRSGVDLRTVQKLLGHATVVTTEHYLPWHVDDLRSAVDCRRYTFDTGPLQ